MEDEAVDYRAKTKQPKDNSWLKSSVVNTPENEPEEPVLECKYCRKAVDEHYELGYHRSAPPPMQPVTHTITVSGGRDGSVHFCNQHFNEHIAKEWDF